MKPAYYAGCCRDGRYELVFFDGHVCFNLIERLAVQGHEGLSAPAWWEGGHHLFSLSRLILLDAIGNTDYVDDMDRLFADMLILIRDKQEWVIPLEAVRAWANRHEQLRQQLRTVLGRNCPSCG